MTKVRANNLTGKIFDNIVFLAEVFGDQDDSDIPKMPVSACAASDDSAADQSSASWAIESDPNVPITMSATK